MEHRPPPPRPRPDLDLACAGLEAGTPPIPWTAVTSRKLAGAWVGLQPDCPASGTGRWLWDIVEPCDERPDPLVIAVPQDIIQVTVTGETSMFSATIAVRRCPQELELPASALPPPPWQLGWATGWSGTTLRQAAQQWLDQHAVQARLAEPTTSSGPDSYDLGEAFTISDGAFDALLVMGDGPARAVTRAFNALLDDLDRRGCL